MGWWTRLASLLASLLGPPGPRPARKGVLVGHGIGEEGKGETLHLVATALARFLQDRLGRDNVWLEARLEGQEGPARVSLTFRHQQGGRSKKERWELAEVWWAQAFRPPRLLSIITWVLWQLWEQTLWTLRGFWRVLRGRYVAWRRTTLPDGTFVPSSPLRDWPIILYDALAAPFWGLMFLLGFFLVLPLVVLLWVLEQVHPLANVLPGLLRVGHQAADYLLTAYIGDVVAYLEDPIAAGAIRQEFRSALRSLADRCDDIYVLGHSWGAVVAYDALCQRDESQDGLARVRKLITVGAGLNRARRLSPALRRARLPAGVRWVDIFARYDIVPAGPARHDGCTGDRRCPVGHRLVSNHDSVLADHVTYWENVEEVLAQLADEIEDGSPPAAFHRSEEQSSDDGRQRKRRLIPLSLLRLAAWGLPLAFFALLTANAYDFRNDFIGLLLGVPVVQTPITWFANLAERAEELRPKPLLLALGNEGRARWALAHLALPAVGAVYIGAGTYLAFRFARDILWRRMMEVAQRCWHHKRRFEMAGGPWP